MMKKTLKEASPYRPNLVFLDTETYSSSVYNEYPGVSIVQSDAKGFCSEYFR